jgi:hypothetical protein
MENPADYGIPVAGGFGFGPNEYGVVLARERREMACGLDLGSINDATALCVMVKVESPEVDAQGNPVFDTSYIQKLMPPIYQIRGLKRLPTGLSYPQIIAQVGIAMSHAEIHGAALVVDRTGVGGPTFDCFVAAGFANLVAITLTGSLERETRNDDGSGFHLGKLQLVSTLQTALQTGVLKMPPASVMPEVKVLLDELRNYAVAISPAGHPSFNAAGSGHDDLVIAAGLAIFHLWPRTGGAWSEESINL